MDNVDKNGKKITPTIKDYDDMSRDTDVDFTITFHKGKLNELESKALEHECSALEKQLKLYTTNTNTNMHLFDANDKLKKYKEVNNIIDDYAIQRLELYKVRKTYLINELTNIVVLLSNKVRYIKEVLDGTIDLRRKKKEQVSQLLFSKNYLVVDNDNDYNI